MREIFEFLEKSGIDPEQILTVVGSWDYLRGIATSLRVGVEEAPYSFLLSRKAASPQMNPWHFMEALQAPSAKNSKNYWANPFLLKSMAEFGPEIEQEIRLI